MSRPAKYDTDEQLSRVIELYFLACKARAVEDGDKLLVDLDDDELWIVNDVISSKPTVSGLAYTLGITTETLREYGTQDKFSATVKRAKQRIEAHLEERLDSGSAAGTIFNLKNNFGWKDKTEQDVNVSGDLAERILRARQRADS